VVTQMREGHYLDDQHPPLEHLFQYYLMLINRLKGEITMQKFFIAAAAVIEESETLV